MSIDSSDHYDNPGKQRSGVKLNWLRAAVLGSNDGIVSVAGVVVGVAAATQSAGIILTAGIAAIVAGALSMAAGEYISVSSQKDTEKALLAQEKQALIQFPEKELEELTVLYMQKGLSRKTAEVVAKELTEKDAYAAHVDVELGIDPSQLINPWHAAIASTIAFVVGSLIPLAAVVFAPISIRVPTTFVAVVLALVLTGSISAHVGGAGKKRAVFRVLVGGILAMTVTYFIGRLVGVSGV